MATLARGGLGLSISTQQPVSKDLRRYLPATLELTGAAIVFAMLTGFPLGILAALKYNKAPDAIARGVDPEPSFADGLAVRGVDVVRIGLASTDGLYFASGALGIPGARAWNDERDSPLLDGIDRVYVVGRAVRPARSQAIISAGAGAVAALDILAREEGKDVQDWDTPPKD